MSYVTVTFLRLDFSLQITQLKAFAQLHYPFLLLLLSCSGPQAYT